MLDWNVDVEVQNEGRQLAKDINPITPFIQPLTEKYNKNVWDNCAKIIGERDDIELKPFLIKLLEWIQDMNWPGSAFIFERLCKYSDNISLYNAISNCINKAIACNDEIWISNLKSLIYKRNGCCHIFPFEDH